MRPKLIALALAYCLGIFVFARYINMNLGDNSGLPFPLFLFLTKISSFLPDLESYHPTVPNIQCFKLVLSFGFLLAIPYVWLSFLLEGDKFIKRAHEDAANKDKYPILLIVGLVIIGWNSIICSSLFSPRFGNSTLYTLTTNLSLWYVQASRTILAVLPTILLIIKGYARWSIHRNGKDLRIARD